MQTSWAIIIEVLVGGIIVLWLLQTVKREPAIIRGEAVLRYGWPIRWAALMATVIVSATVLWLAANTNGPWTIGSIALCAAAFTAINLEIFCVQIAFNEETITTRSPWRRVRIIPLTAIEKIVYRPHLHRFEIITNGYGKVLLPDFLNGRSSLLEHLNAHGMLIYGTPPGGW